MKFPELLPAVFIKRNNRFTAGVRLETGEITTAFVPTTGRLTGALRPNCRVWLARAGDPNRKTPYTLTLAELEHGGLCSVDALMANRLFEESVNNHRLKAFPYPEIDREVPYGRSRLDFRLSDGGQSCWVEVKSVTYAEDGVGKFPDAPTGRGRRHLQELAKIVREGGQSSAVFIAQRADATTFMPFEVIDPDFAETLRQVRRQGVGVHAYRCQLGLGDIEIAEEIPVVLDT